MKLRKKFKRYFWDCDFEEFSKNAKKYKIFIAERILVFGDTAAVKWLLKNYKLEAILNIVKTSKKIDKMTRNYWLTIYER
ncbi:MAG TPA: hypothetical protein PLD27_12795 [bacterium]|nr:hypothetical protein [bacterium]HPP87087.1 hypothetical protein [bacterium]